MKRKNRNQTQTHSANLVTRFISQFAELGINQIKTAITNFISLFIFVIVLVFAVIYIGIPSLGSLFNSLSPWNQQKQEISAKNNVRDAYSSIIGSNVGIISQNAFISWFSSKEAKEIDISIPKLINYSPLFDDDSNRSQLKTAFENSINNDTISQSTSTYRIFYDGSTLSEWKNGKKISSYRDLSKVQKKKILADLQKKIWNKSNVKFNEWEKIGNQDNVDFDFKPSSNRVKIIGKFLDKGSWFFGVRKKKYKLYVEYDLKDDDTPVLVDKSLKVEKVK
ncbi:hypothetical protein DXB55_02375 [Streptococcus anginosus]|uniref:hypothetical protein n=1 Tax=Streptococcus anginosus TaxID=1328 RepID=UPI0002329666|nr:hypothetical protein [Streptococcus anginosus]EHG14494.1 hypothetical protein HMPREF9682_00531 [Streptococcus intermedius F0395]RGN68558.1 hypothetical protein DXB55_02375 [Streptococcus anginosus]